MLVKLGAIALAILILPGAKLPSQGEAASKPEVLAQGFEEAQQINAAQAAADIVAWVQGVQLAQFYADVQAWVDGLRAAQQQQQQRQFRRTTVTNNGAHSDAWWQGVTVCEQSGKNDPYFGYFSIMDGSAGGLDWSTQVAMANAIIARAGDGAWAAKCVAAGYAAAPGG